MLEFDRKKGRTVRCAICKSKEPYLPTLPYARTSLSIISVIGLAQNLAGNGSVKVP